MFNQKITDNIYFIIPTCCYLKYEHTQWHKQVLRAFKWIRKTPSGNHLLETIGKSSHQVFITTHFLHTSTLDKSCKELANRFKTHAHDEIGAKTPTNGSSSTIFLDPERINSIYFTTPEHYYCCQSRLLVNRSCFQPGSKCLKKVSVMQILFHELVHAMRNALGLNQRIQTTYFNKNLEEQAAIKAENIFLDELTQLDDLLEDVDLRHRITHAQPHLYEGGVENIIAHQLQPQKRDFLIYVVPKIISSIGNVFEKKQHEDSTEFLIKSYPDSDDLYLYNE